MRSAILALILTGLTPLLRAGETNAIPSTTYQVPYRLTGTNHVLVRVKINGKGPYHFILDTGAPALFVSTAVGRKLGVKPDKQGWGTFERFAIEGGVVLTNAKGRIEDPFQLEGMNGLGLAGVELHGIIGYTVLARFRLSFDFTQDKMGWTPLAFEPPAPQGVEGKAPPGLEALGGIMKMVGAILGRKPDPEVTLRGFLGMGLEDGGDAVVVKTVLPGGPAANAGLQAGDRIRRFQGKNVRSVADVQRLAAKLAAGEAATLTITRSGDMQTIRIKAGKGL
jgi:PDZ domain/Aspartyl protease